MSEAPDDTGLRAVGAGLVVRAGRVLVQARPDPGRWQGYWEFPGGGVEPGESLEACVRRECDEEVGLAVTPGEVLHEVRWSPSGRGGVHVVFVLCACAPDAAPEPRLGQELRWAGPDELARLRFLPANAEVVARLRARLAAEAG